MNTNLWDLILSSRGMIANLGIGYEPLKLLVEAVALNDGFSVICRGMVAPLIIARPLFVQ